MIIFVNVMPVVSVIIPVYNVEPFIEKCVRSLFEQTLADLEYIFVDDNTPDHSMEIVYRVLNDYPMRVSQVKYLHFSDNQGLPHARMAGVSCATGDYIVHCDSDDYVSREAYQRMYEKALAEDSDIVTCDFYIQDPDKRRVQTQRSASGRELSDLLCCKVWANVWCRMIKRELWDGIIEPNANMWEDLAFTVQTVFKASRCSYLPVPLYFYCRRSSSMSQEMGMHIEIKRWKELVSNVKLVTDFLAGNPVDKYNDSDILRIKLRSREALIPYVHKAEYYALWRNTFPEINRRILWCPQIPFETKFWFILVFLRLYHPWKTVTGFFRRIIASIQ